MIPAILSILQSFLDHMIKWNYTIFVRGNDDEVKLFHILYRFSILHKTAWYRDCKFAFPFCGSMLIQAEPCVLHGSV